VVLAHKVEDRLIWRWSASGAYSTFSAYVTMFVGQTQILGAKELWKVNAPEQVSFFLLVSDAWQELDFEGMPRCHGIRDDALCDQEGESMDHLLATCLYAREVWFKDLQCCGWQGLTVLHHASFIERWLVAAHAKA
jgi:hypothetical protein